MDIGLKGLTAAEARDVAAQLEAEGFLALEERVGVIRDPAPDKIGSIHIPDAAQVKPIRGTVVMRGEMIQSDIQIGDRVVFTKYRPTLMEFPLLNGDSVFVELMTVSDIYVRWR